MDFVEPTPVRLPLSKGRYIDVKRRLNAGETRRVFSRMVAKMQPGEPIDLNPELVGFTKVSEYLIGWSLTDSQGRPVPISDAAINNLDPDLYFEITRAVNNHEAEIEAQLELEKKDPASESASSPT
jgi:hypothetical protein